MNSSEERPITCDRVCNRADWPRICRFELVVEKRTYHPDSNSPGHDNVSLAVGRKSSESPVIASYYTVNGRYVGPTLTVCENDFLVVDVENRIPGESISLHWTGQSQRRTPYMDGVPMITQCPIASFTRFQYRFQADKAGTHLYHGFTGMERTQGLLGAFVVRSAYEQKRSPVLSMFPDDTVWLVTELQGALAVNGQRSWYPTYSLNGTTGNTNLRVRLLYAVSQCQHWVELEDHNLQVLTLDGNGLEHGSMPSVKRLLLHDGTRMDLTFNRRVPMDGDKIKRDYEIRFTPLDTVRGSCERAVFSLRFDSLLHGHSHTPGAGTDEADGIKYNLISPPILHPPGEALDLVGNDCGTSVLCPQDLPGAADQFPKDLAAYDTRLEFTISKQPRDGTGPFGEPIRETVHSVNGFTFAFPSVLMLREPANDELRAHTCGGHRTLPRSCHPLTVPCECVHVVHIEAGHRVEMVLINADAADDYVYHLHGQSVFVVGMATGHQKLVTNLTAPVQRDTIVVRRDSIVVVRFVANNAGLWLLRDIGSPSWSRGLDVVLNVGEPYRLFVLVRSSRYTYVVLLPGGYPGSWTVYFIGCPSGPPVGGGASIARKLPGYPGSTG
uniref:Plastocyanin-like domain-containing protein n=1 Tax=Anopheles culicifacies TaxID=139723 RepID=A0A182M3K7_9DIPT